MITKNGILRPNKNSSLLTNSKLKTRPTKFESSEPEIDFNNVPTIQGTYKASKIIPSQNTSIKTNSTKDQENFSSTTTTTTTTTSKAPETTNFSTSGSTNTKAEVSTKSTLSSTVKVEDELHKDFVKPDFETSPWKPIIPTFINTDLKPLPERNEAQFKPDPTKMTNPYVQTIRDKEIIRDEELILGTPISEVKPPDLFFNKSQVVRPNPPGMNTFDAEETDFPHDRVVPQEEASGKVKNNLLIFERNFTIEQEDRRPDIEIAGQLPPDTFELRLKTSSESAKEVDKSHLDMVTQNSGGSTVSFERNPVSRLDDSSFSSSSPITLDFETSELPTLLIKDTDSFTDFEEAPSRISGIGVAEPVSDLEIDLEARNRYSEIAAIGDDTSLKKEVVHQPIYTSYRTPDLNGGARPSLVENSGTLKPFRHTIPVDKITSVLKDVEETLSKNDSFQVKKHDPEKHLRTGVATITAVEFERSDDKTDSKHIVTGSPRVPVSQKNQNQFRNEPLPILERIVEIETFVKDTENDSLFRVNLPKDSDLQLTEEEKSTEKTVESKETTKIAEEIEKIEDTTTSEKMDSFVENLNFSEEESRGDVSLKIDEKPHQEDSTMKKLQNSRNSTFVEINTMKHVPGKGQLSVGTLEEPSLWFAGNESSVTTLDAKRKVYNDTLKANVVENLVTLAPVKSNTGVRPIRPRPKIDKEKSTRLLEKSSTSETPLQALNEAALLNRLFNLQALTSDPVRREFADIENGTRVVKPLNHENGSVEQIIEVVTSISTKVSSSVQGNPVTLKLIVSNSSAKNDVKHSESKSSDNKYAGIIDLGNVNSGNVNLRNSGNWNSESEENGRIADIEETRAFQDEGKSRDEVFSWSSDSSGMQTSDRKTSAGQQNQFLIDQLKQFADVRTVDDSGTPKPNNKVFKSSYVNSRVEDLQSETSPNVEELKKIADIVAGNETVLKNTSSSFTVSRDGVEVMTKVLMKKEERENKKISTTEENLLQNAGEIFTLIILFYIQMFLIQRNHFLSLDCFKVN